ncbi:MAG: tRNA (guanosine(37)-N1)-methyltransferase TrmD [Flavobacteriales bacterium]|nr:tRNA (guanosine(37)-N1)-methyltransferase TrmD [Flavobacteriales bacterium]|tara:strand:+ start:139 stop:816 length:678 start_codon:yes stop_codon:yes gene_type:complete
MRIDILTLHPELIESPFNYSIIKRAKEKKIVNIFFHQIRDYSIDKKVDDNQFGGGSGMVMKIEPISNLIENLTSKRKYDEIVYLTPEGKLLDQKKSNLLSTLNNIIILCGHYKGIDQRIRDLYITKEISIGDYVLSGGELAAAILCDTIIRLIPGVLNDETSALNDSLQDNLLQPPLYTRPREFKGMKVPDILLSGHQQNIQIWRDKMSLEKTNKLRPDLIKKFK